MIREFDNYIVVLMICPCINAHRVNGGRWRGFPGLLASFLADTSTQCVSGGAELYVLLHDSHLFSYIITRKLSRKFDLKIRLKFSSELLILC